MTAERRKKVKQMKNGPGMNVLLVLLVFLVPYAILSAYFPPRVQYFPTLDQPIRAYPEARYQGRLVVEDGAIRLRSPLPTFGFLVGPSVLVVWPYGYSVSVEGGRTVIRDDSGRTVARVGDFVSAGGGTMNIEYVESATGQPLPDRIHGPVAFMHSPTVQGPGTWLSKAESSRVAQSVNVIQWTGLR